MSGEDCEFCRCHEKEDVLYELVNWDCGLAFDEIRNIKYCPLCGAMLKGSDDDLLQTTSGQCWMCEEGADDE